MFRSLLALGSNQGDSRSTILQAATEIEQLPSTELTATSSIHRSEPIGGPAGQSEFANAAAIVETSLDPLQLLRHLQAVEQKLGRHRRERWGPRTIDVDLLLYDSLQMVSDELVLPHPRMSFRPFVLEPAVEIAADWVHPTLKATLERLLEATRNPHGGLLIYGGNDADRQFHANHLSVCFDFLAIDRTEPDSVWLAASDSPSPVAARLAIELCDKKLRTRTGLPTLKIPAKAREEVLFDTTAAVEAVWGDLGLGQSGG